MKYVIIGSGASGISAAKTIKQLDPSCDITIINKEHELPYKRFLLTEYLLGNIKKDKLFYLSSEYFKNIKIQLRLGQSVKSINTNDKFIKLEHNEVIHYDKLLISTGGIPDVGPTLKPFKKLIHSYYSLQDIMKLEKLLPETDTCIVTGEGVSTLDLLRTLLHYKKKIIYITQKAKVDFNLPQSNFTDTICDLLSKRGVLIYRSDRIINIKKTKQYYIVKTFSNKEISGDIVFASDYYKPKLDFIEGTKIQKKLGILVDLMMKTSVEDIYAAGDCVEIYHPIIADYWINFGWKNATEQGTIAGQNMTGLNINYNVHDTITFNIMGKSLEGRWWE